MPGAGVRAMKRLLCLTAALCLCVSCALAQPAQAEPTVTEAAPLTGERTYPEGADPASAAYVYRYTLPQFTQQSPQAAALNAYFAAMADDMAAAAQADAADALDVPADPAAPARYTELGYRITASTADLVSVLLTSRQSIGNAETESWTATVFALSGVYAGQPVSLTQAMGLEQEDGAADTAESYAAGLVYGLIWQIIGEQTARQSGDYFPDLTRADLERALNPESDFYLDADGNFVFYIQSGVLAGDVAGVLTFPFAPAELLSAARP